MAATQVAESLWTNLLASGLLPAKQVNSLKKEFLSAGVASDADAAAALVQRGVLTQFQSERLLEGRSRGFFFDHYKLLDLLGVGGMGWVYRAVDTRTNQVVALKVLLEQFKHDRGMLARFQQEAQTTLKLNHPNIVKTYALGQAGGSHYMIMEFVEGPSLLEVLLRVGKLPVWQACEICRQAALGLEHAHQAGLVHRDVKPQNLLIDKTGRVKLLDFGLAMVREGESGDEFSMAMIFGHESVGTAAYMAPEQALDSLSVDARSDIYGLGCTLFAALTGDTPFSERSVAELQKAHRLKAPRSVTDLAPSVPAGVSCIVERMLAKDRSQRFASAAEVAEQLAQWSRPVPIQFDFAPILEERKRQAREKQADWLKSRPKSMSGTGSTARPSAVSSVVTLGTTTTTKLSPSGRPVATGTDGTGSHSVSSAMLEEMAKPDAVNHHPVSNLDRSGAVLVPIQGDGFHPLNQTRILVGRNDDCAIQLKDSSVSGRHCELHFDGNRWWITDLNSRNGTRVNGVRVKHRPLKPGDQIAIGTHLKYRLDCAEDAGSIRQRKARRKLLTVGLSLVILLAVMALGWVIFGRR